MQPFDPRRASSYAVPASIVRFCEYQTEFSSYLDYRPVRRKNASLEPDRRNSVSLKSPHRYLLKMARSRVRPLSWKRILVNAGLSDLPWAFPLTADIRPENHDKAMLVPRVDLLALFVADSTWSVDDRRSRISDRLAIGKYVSRTFLTWRGKMRPFRRDPHGRRRN